jgi:hypothetical protein
MQVQVPHASEMLVGTIERVLHGALVRLVVTHYAILHLFNGELAGIDRFSGVEDPPDEADALLRLGARDRGPGPRALEE